MAGLPGNSFDAGDTLVFSFMCEHRPLNNISDGIDSGNIRTVLLVNRDAPAFGRFETEILRDRSFKIWRTSARYENFVAAKLQSLLGLAHGFDGGFAVGERSGSDRCFKMEFQAIGCHCLLQCLRHIWIKQNW